MTRRQGPLVRLVLLVERHPRVSFAAFVAAEFALFASAIFLGWIR